MRTFFVVLSLLGLCVGPADAGMIYDNGASDQTDGWEMTRWIEADDFALSSTARLNSIKFWSFEFPGFFEGSITWQIYSNSGSNTPGVILREGSSTNLSREATGFSAFGSFKEYVNTFDIPPVTLPAGTYWLALHNGPLANNLSENFFWSASSKTTGGASRNMVAPFSGSWYSNLFPGFSPDVAFLLNGVAAPLTAPLSFNNQVPKITFTAASGQYYQVEYKNSLSDPSWQVVSGADMILGNGDPVLVSDPDVRPGNVRRRFYRVVAL